MQMQFGRRIWEVMMVNVACRVRSTVRVGVKDSRTR